MLHCRLKGDSALGLPQLCRVGSTENKTSDHSEISSFFICANCVILPTIYSHIIMH